MISVLKVAIYSVCRALSLPGTQFVMHLTYCIFNLPCILLAAPCTRLSVYSVCRVPCLLCCMLLLTAILYTKLLRAALARIKHGSCILYATIIKLTPSAMWSDIKIGDTKNRVSYLLLYNEKKELLLLPLGKRTPLVLPGVNKKALANKMMETSSKTK